MKRLLVVALVVGLGWFWWAGRSDVARAAPDERLARHVGAVCRIFEKHVKSPDTGVARLFGYLGKHTPQIFGLFGETLVVIEDIPDDAAHDARAREAAARLRAPAEKCEEPAERFFEAVERDPAARARFERGANRLERTLTILFGGEAAAWLPLDALGVRGGR